MLANTAAPLARIQGSVRTVVYVALVMCTTLSCVRPASYSVAIVPGPLGPGQRQELFKAVWTHVAERYYEPTYHGADWRAVKQRYAPLVDAASDDNEVHRVIERMVGELRDAHSRYLPPAQAAVVRGRVSRGIGATVAEVEGVPVIDHVSRGSPAERAGLQPGMRVVAVDGESVEERYARLNAQEPVSSTERATRALLWRRIISGADSTVSMLVEHEGTKRHLAASRRTTTGGPQLSARMMDDDVLYLRFDGFRVPIAAQLRDSMHAYPDARAIVLDLRNNGGGDAAETIRAAGTFLPQKIAAGEFFSRVPRLRFGFLEMRDRTRPVTGGAVDADTRPLAILTSALSGSGAELMSVLLQEDGRATIVGDTTCGCLTAVTDRLTMPGGGMLMISNRGYRTPRGVIVEGRGVAPDVVVRATRADLVAGRDAVLDAALHLLARQPTRATAGNE